MEDDGGSVAANVGIRVSASVIIIGGSSARSTAGGSNGARYVEVTPLDQLPSDHIVTTSESRLCIGNDFYGDVVTPLLLRGRTCTNQWKEGSGSSGGGRRDRFDARLTAAGTAGPGRKRRSRA